MKIYIVTNEIDQQTTQSNNVGSPSQSFHRDKQAQRGGCCLGVAH